MNSTNDSFLGNATAAAPTPNPAAVAAFLAEVRRLEYIRDVLEILIMVLIVIINFGMGWTIDIHTVIKILKKPVGPVIGVICQFAIMPLTAFLLALIFQMDDTQTLALLITGSCPGGTTSNAAALWMKGDMDLSITMTTVSSILALGMMPLLLFIYSQAYEGDLQVPFSSIGIGLALAVPPVIIGMLGRWKFPKRADLIAKILSGIGCVAIFAAIIIQVVVFRDTFQLTSNQWACAAVFPVIGLSLGFGAATGVSQIKRFRLTLPQRTTISIETGVQNSQLAVAIINLAGFTRQKTGKMVLFPVIYLLFQLTYLGILIGILHSYLRCCKKHRDGDDEIKEKESTKDEDKPPVYSVDNQAYEDDEKR